MINNRQGGRRRGRGGQRPQGMAGRSDGNRQDNRQRGNAVQLHEKYKSMARDAQLAGDRVQTEYYLQFADHYFRVLSESRVRFEEQRRQRGDDMDSDEDAESGSSANEPGFSHGDGEEMVEAEAEAEAGERPQRSRGRDRDDRPARGERPQRGNGRARDEREPAEADAADERIPFDALPPAIGADEPASEAVEEEARPRRRARRPRDEDGEAEIAPAA